MLLRLVSPYSLFVNNIQSALIAADLRVFKFMCVGVYVGLPVYSITKCVYLNAYDYKILRATSARVLDYCIMSVYLLINNTITRIADGHQTATTVNSNLGRERTPTQLLCARFRLIRRHTHCIHIAFYSTNTCSRLTADT